MSILCKRYLELKWIALALMLLSTSPNAATRLVSPSENLAQIMLDAADGDILLLSEGTYTAQATTYAPTAPVFRLIRPITIKASGDRDRTILTVDSARDWVMMIHAGQNGTTHNPSGAIVEGVTIQGAQGGIFVKDYQELVGGRLSDITLKNVRINLSSPTSGHGVEMDSIDRGMVIGLDINDAFANGIYLHDNENSLVARNIIRSSRTQHGIGITSGRSIRVIENTVTGAAFDGIILLRTTNSRIERNTLSGFTVDGITVTDGSTGNWIGHNSVRSGVRAAGRRDGTGIWLNCSANNNVVIGNLVSGSPENGISIFAASNNLIEGNKVFGNAEGGIFVWDNKAICLDSSYPGERPTYNLIRNNWSFYNDSNAMVIDRGGRSTNISFNHLSGVDGFGGTLASSNTGGIQLQTSSDTQIIGNTISRVNNGHYLFSDVTQAKFFHNRHFGVSLNYAIAPTVAQWDGGMLAGGNFWSTHAVSGNPSQGSGFADFVYDSIGHRGGGNIDNFPFSSESLGRAYSLSVLQPLAGQAISANSFRGIRWKSAGCVYVDIGLQNLAGHITMLASNYPDIGYYTWNTADQAAGSYTLLLTCKNSAGNAVGVVGGVSGLTLSGNSLGLLSHHAGENLTAGQTSRVYWMRNSNSDTVTVYLSVENGSESLLANAVSADFADITIPTDASATARLRIIDSNGTQDSSDGYFSIRKNSAARITSPTAGDFWSTNSVEEITWLSPPGSSLVNLEAWNGTAWQPIVYNYPDVGRFAWTTPPYQSNSAQLRTNFYATDGASLGSVSSDSLSVGMTSGVNLSAQTMNCFLNWAESDYSEYLSPNSGSSSSAGNYFYRHYANSKAYLGISSQDGHVYYLAESLGNQLLDLGLFTDWKERAGCNN